MTIRMEDKCPYCDTEFMVEFENDDDELVFCPSCGEELPDEELNDNDELDFEDD